MKKHFLLSLSVAISSVALSQPVLQAGMFGSANQASQMSFFQADGLNPGQGGAQQNWDFSDAPTNGTSDTIGLVSVESIGQTANFPTATAAIRSVMDGEVIYQLIRTSGNGLEMLGMVTDNPEMPYVRRYTNPMKAFSLPLSFNQTGSDDFECFMAITGSPIGIDFKVVTVGQNSFSADGYGNLNLPGNVSFSNVLRVHQLEESVDTVFFESPFPIDPQITTRRMHTWWWMSNLPAQNPIKMVITVDSSLDEGASDWQVSTNAFYESQTVTSVRPVSSELALDLAPNPTQDRFTIRFKNATPHRVSILRPDGKLLNHFETNAGESQAPVSCTDWSPGLYLIRVESGNQVHTQKLLKN